MRQLRNNKNEPADRPETLSMTINAPDTRRDFTPAELVRIHEANCQLQFATAPEQNFRIAMMKYIARRLGLVELRSSEMTGPGVGVPRPKLAGGARP
jgi:hypothetical protein